MDIKEMKEKAERESATTSARVIEFPRDLWNDPDLSPEQSAFLALIPNRYRPRVEPVKETLAEVCSAPLNLRSHRIGFVSPHSAHLGGVED